MLDSGFEMGTTKFVQRLEVQKIIRIFIMSAFDSSASSEEGTAVPSAASATMDEIDDSRFVFTAAECNLEFFNGRERKEMLMQWNLDANLVVKRFRFSGQLLASSSEDYAILIRELMQSQLFRSEMDVSGSPSGPVPTEELSITAMSMNFFDFLKEADIVSTAGTIRGCFDEEFDGITVGKYLHIQLFWIFL